ncbi:MAG: hypothetical protein IPK76_12965 [Lewinellaceae bacterium]|nr:hypothetical protein [Lewinellaceae bacterium]
MPALEREGDNASSRNHYRDLAMKMKKVKQDIEGSHLAVDTLARSLILKYPRRPAMVEEMTNGVLEARF